MLRAGRRVEAPRDDFGPSTSGRATPHFAPIPLLLTPRLARRLAAKASAFNVQARSTAVAAVPIAVASAVDPSSGPASASFSPSIPASPSSPRPSKRDRGPLPSPSAPSTATAARYDRRSAVPLWRKAERDLLPDGTPNVPWRRLAYQIRMAPSIPELLELLRSHVHAGDVWRPHHTALVASRTGALLYPQAIAASAAATPEAGAAPSELKADVNALLQSLSGVMNLTASRQVHALHNARLIVVLSWIQISGPRTDTLVTALVKDLLRQRAGRLASVATIEPALFARTVRALAQLAPNNQQLWVELQRLCLASLMQAAAEQPPPTNSSASAGAAAAAAAAGGGVTRRLWGARPAPDERECPDCSQSDLAHMAFGFAAAGKTTPALFEALRAAALSRPLPSEPDTLANLAWAWARTGLPPGFELPNQLMAAFRPLLDTVPARPLGRFLWALGVMGFRDQSFLAAAGETIVRRRLVFGSTQELVNVCWAFSQLGARVGPNQGERRPALGPSPEREAEERSRPRVQQRRAPAPIGEGESDGEEGRAQEGGGWRGAAAEAGAASGGEEERAGESEEEEEEPASARGAAPEGGEEEDQGEAARQAAGERWRAGRAESGAEQAAAANQGPQPSRAPPRPDSMRPLPLAAVLATEERRRQATAQVPKPDPATPLALYRHLASLFLTGRTGPYANRSWSMTDSQLAVLAASFARAGYGNTTLFYTMARMAVRRMATLAPGDLSLLLSAHARVRVRHDALFDAACAVVERRARDFTPWQLADLMWAVQLMQPGPKYAKLADAVRQRRSEEAGHLLRGAPASTFAAPAAATAGSFAPGRGPNTMGPIAPMPPHLAGLVVPPHLLRDPERYHDEDVEEEDGQAEDGSLWDDVRLRSTSSLDDGDVHRAAPRTLVVPPQPGEVRGPRSAGAEGEVMDAWAQQPMGLGVDDY
ncbi:hypothetical protein HYH03_005613 [Edaphochlamys debaryana]|uniref:Uncharacterized protein n=1 Tax=Edaphochlamys debaryana TaxID=47281 RepID=A0A835YCL0_9CHLO|nr:hypothetical protein HYH03_005613 [Edaphochlamys debaryana]|eukprot:KAG2496385.1 hypothetical protein HYH03_005613 [Edaphochlamys debaryana]